MTFKLYSSPVIVEHLWEATYDVVVVERKINVILGKPNNWGNPKEIPFTVFDGSTKYLGLKVGTDPDMTPRKEIVSVAYAYHQMTRKIWIARMILNLSKKRKPILSLQT